MAYGDFKDLAKLTALHKVSSNKAFNIAKAPKYDWYQRGLASMTDNVFDKKSSSSGDNKNKIKQNQLIKQLAEELHKPLIRKFKILKRTVYSSFKDYIWGADLADMILISKFSKGIRFSLCVIDIFTEYASAVPLKDEKVVTIVNSFQNILNS